MPPGLAHNDDTTCRTKSPVSIQALAGRGQSPVARTPGGALMCACAGLAGYKSCDSLFKMADGYFDIRFYNIVVLGISFMLIFTAFQTCSMVEVSCKCRDYRIFF